MNSLPSKTFLGSENTKFREIIFLTRNLDHKLTAYNLHRMFIFLVCRDGIIEGHFGFSQADVKQTTCRRENPRYAMPSKNRLKMCLRRRKGKHGKTKKNFVVRSKRAVKIGQKTEMISHTKITHRSSLVRRFRCAARNIFPHFRRKWWWILIQFSTLLRP